MSGTLCYGHPLGAACFQPLLQRLRTHQSGCSGELSSLMYTSGIHICVLYIGVDREAVTIRGFISTASNANQATIHEW